MSTLTGNKIKDTYNSLIKLSDNGNLTATLKLLSDGLGNSSGVYLNTAGDFKSTGTLEFANFKATAHAVTINKLVNEADGISNNDNDTSLPTSAAVKDYVDTHVTSQDLDFSDGTTQSAIDLDSQVFSIIGTTNEIETVASGQQLQIGLPNDVTISGTFTGTTFSGDLNGTINTATIAVTQTAGDNSTKVATTAYVDTLDAASDLDFSGDSGTGDVNLNTQVLAVTGTANQIETTANNQGLSLSFPSTITIPDGSVATTQSSGDNSTKIATTAYVDTLDAASDLDIAGDSGTGAINLNTETFTLAGTTNQITTDVSGQTATFSLPSTIHRDLQGDVTGNADTATTWQTARDLSLTSEATGILSSVDGSSNVSGAVTLLNSAVTGKVLTGLGTPTAGNIVASDSILEAFGKIQSQLNTSKNGLVFKGTWSAATNTPTLTSGGGETDAGTTTSASTNKLVDTTQNFLSTVSIGNKVINQADGSTALVTNIDSNTTLTLDADIMLSGEAYTIDASPFLQQGEYYVVNAGGTTNLNGNANWAIGDWVIAGADNVWSKLDHSQVDGSGTPGKLTKWATVNTLQDSIVGESGTALTVTGSLTTTLGASVTGDFAVNTDKFTVNATSGNISVAGTGAFAGNVEINDTISGNFTTNYDTKLLVGGEIVARSLTANESMISIGGDSTSAFIKSGKQDGSLTGRDLRFVRGSDEKLRVISTGIDITGAINADSATITGDVTITGDLSTTNSLGSIITVSRDAVPTSGNSLGRFEFSGEDIDTGNQYVTALISASAEANWATSSRTTQLNFNTTTGGVLSRALTLKGNNDAEFEGNATFAGSVQVGSTAGYTTISQGAFFTKGGGDMFTANLLAGAAVSPMFKLQRNDVEKYNIGLDGNDNLAFINASGDAKMSIDSSGNLLMGLTSATTTDGTNIELASSTSSRYILASTGTGGHKWTMATGTDGALAFYDYTESAYRMRIDSSGLVTITRSFTPAASLSDITQLKIENTDTSFGGSAAGIQLDAGNGDTTGFILSRADGNDNTFEGVIIGTATDNPIIFSTNTGTTSITTNERMRIDSSGNIGFSVVAENSSGTWRNFQIGGANLVTRSNNNNDLLLGTGFYFNTASQELYKNTEAVSRMFFNNDEITFQNAASGTAGTAITWNERMRIDSSGNLNIVGRNSGASNTSMKLIFDNTDVTVQANQLVGGIEWHSDDGSGAGAGIKNSINSFFTGSGGYADMRFSTSGTDGNNTERMRITSDGDIEVTGGSFYNSSSGITYIGNNSEFEFVDSLASGTKRFRPGVDNSFDLGDSSRRWDDVWATNPQIQTSDRNEKNTIKDTDLGLDFINKLKPVSYKWNNKTRTHYGLIAQDVQEVLEDISKDTKDFAGFIKADISEEKDNSKHSYGLRYNEFISPMIKAIQELKAEVDSLKKECKCK